MMMKATTTTTTPRTKARARNAVIPLALLVLAGLLPSCSSTPQSTRADAGPVPGSSQYGSLAPVREMADFRALRHALPGQSMHEVVDRLGSPSRVTSFGGGESWRYADAAYDRETKRPVNELTVWFEDGIVDEVRASF